MEEIRERRASLLEGKELNIYIKEMHTYMRGTELKDEEEEFWEREKALKKREEELAIHERELEKRKKMYRMSFNRTQ
jgi:hypothetical protein